MQAATEDAIVAVRERAVSIGEGTLGAWLVDLDAPGVAGAAVLDAAERARAASFVRQQDGTRFAASRAALRVILARYLGTEPGDLEFQLGPRGQPRVAGAGVRFSLARSEGLALIAVSREPVGVDLERIRPRRGLADLAASRFPAREAARIAGGCCGPPTVSFYRHWTAKEAYLKAAGLGLAGLRTVEVLCGARPASCVAGRAVTGCSLSTVSATAAYATAIVTGCSLSAVSAAAAYATAMVGQTPATNWRWLSTARPTTAARPAGCSP
jgi:4'-phosphopantetheinyl transferase